MTTQTIDPKEKAGYVCPTCRMIFSLSQDLGGNGVTCPGCEHLLTVPSSADKVSELVVSKEKYVSHVTKGSMGEVVKYQRTLAEGERHEWADESEVQRESNEKSLKYVSLITLFSLLLIGGLAYLLMSGSGSRSEEEMIAGKGKQGGDSSDLRLNGSVGNDFYVYDPKNEAQVEQLEDFLTGLLASKTVDDMLPYVRPVENIREKMVKFYKGQAISQSAFRSLSSTMKTASSPGFLSFVCQTQDYSNSTGVLEYGEDEVLLDWESYVAYCDMTWDELAAKKPTTAVRVRVTAKRAYYYNNEFADEHMWQAVSLINPNEEDPIYGYVEKGSATDQLLFNFGNSDNRRVILDIYFPSDAKKGDQVFIEGIVQDGWVITEEN